MGILKIVDSAEPLTQGDVFKGIKLFVTGADWLSAGGSAEQVDDSKYCLVISRPCACIFGQKSQITVASVQAFSAQIPETIQDLDHYRRYFAVIRDGRDMPDRFYIGQLPGLLQQRHCARLDSLHTIQLPETQSEIEQFVAKNRVARLSPEFARDLHLRVFRSYSELGFDDYEWYDTSDLRMVISSGNRQMSALRGELETKKLDLSQRDMGGSLNAKHKANLETQIRNLESDLTKLDEELRPYLEELSRRDEGTKQSTL